MSNPLISVIIPNYNGRLFVGRCLESVMSQSYQNLEIIVVDDGSTDDSFAVYDQHMKKDQRIKLIKQTNQGLSAARNKGLSEAKGEYVSFVDSDDYLSKEAIDQLYQALVSANAGISVCGICHINGLKDKKVALSKQVLTTGQALLALCQDEKVKNYAWGKLYRREFFGSIKYPVGRTFEDINTTWKLFELSENIALTEYIGYNYVFRDGSISRVPSLNTSINRLKAFYDRFVEMTPKHPELKEIALEKLLFCYFLLARSYVTTPKKDKQQNVEAVIECLQIAKELPRQENLPTAYRKALNVLHSAEAKDLYKLLLLDVYRKVSK